MCGQVVFPCDLTSEGVEVDVFLGLLGVALGFVVFDKGASDVCACSHEAFVFGRELDVFG